MNSKHGDTSQKQGKGSFQHLMWAIISKASYILQGNVITWSVIQHLELRTVNLLAHV